MKLFIAALIVSVGLFTSCSLNAQQKQIKVQGHPHEVLTRKVAEGTAQPPVARPAITGSTTNIIPDSVHCWAGNPDERLQVDTAYVLVKFTDKKREPYGDGTLLWGYRFNAGQSKTSLDMIRAVGNADPRFIVLLQNANVQYGYTVAGIGYNYAACERVPIWFDLNSAVADSAYIGFRYYYPPNTGMGQTKVPENPQEDVDAAIEAANATGIIVHPFDVVTYGYAAYDYDWWGLIKPEVDNPDYEWQSGWYHNGYWSFYTKDQLNGPFEYSGVGVSGRELKNNFVDGFTFSINFSPADMSGDYVGAVCSCAKSPNGQ
jgi:hypothetical protein